MSKLEIPKNKVLNEMKVGGSVVSIRRKYVSDLNQVCFLDSNYEYDYALYLDYLYQKGTIAGWVRNQTKFGFSEEIEVRGKSRNHTSRILSSSCRTGHTKSMRSKAG